MKKISVSKVINADIISVWHMFSEFNLVHKFHPMVELSPLSGKIHTGKGAERICTMYNGMKATEVITDCKEYEYLKIEIIKSPMPFKQTFGEFYFIKIDENTSRINIDMYLEPKFGIFGDLLFNLVMKRQLAKMLNGVLEGLNNYLASGYLIGKNGIKLDYDSDFVNLIKHDRAA